MTTTPNTSTKFDLLVHLATEHGTQTHVGHNLVLDNRRYRKADLERIHEQLNREVSK